MPIALRFAARSDVGLGSKKRNEDSGYASNTMLVLADGMGGHAGGDIASSIAVHHLEGLDHAFPTPAEAEREPFLDMCAGIEREIAAGDAQIQIARADVDRNVLGAQEIKLHTIR